MSLETESGQEAKGYKFKWGFKTWAEKIAIEYRSKLQLNPHDPLCSFVLAEHLEIEVFHPGDISGMNSSSHALNNGTWSALTMKDDQKKNIIIHNPNHSEARQQSDVMHEIAHVICNHTLDVEENRNGFPLLRQYNQDHEMEAFWLGSCLQLPRSCLVHAIGHKMSVKKISEYYVASESMVNFRIGITGVKKQFSHRFSKS